MLKLKKAPAILAALSVMFAAGFLASCSSDDNGGDSGPAKGTQGGNEGGGTETPTYDDSALSAATLFVVGDSTVCDYGYYDKGGVVLDSASIKITDSTYFYPRYGYGMQLYNYLSSKITVNNLALSGRSSKSFIDEENYTTLKNSIKSGDFLLIGFGHNDEKSDDETRFAVANGSTETEGSFKYNLYNYYVKVALDAGATPILCSPVVRANASNDYSGNSGHVTATGDYGKDVVELGAEKGVQVVDLTSITKELYTSLGYEKAIYFHAMTSGSSATEPKVSSADQTHLNIYGAKMVASKIAAVIKGSSCALAPYISSTEEPAQETDLIKNPLYTYSDYTAVDWSSYNPAALYADDTSVKYGGQFNITTEGWHGTAFGDCGGNPAASSNNYFATETSTGVFKVGQTTSKKGKIAGSSEGFAFLFKQVPVTDNFTVTVNVKVLEQQNTKQAAFGLMLRDDCYVPTNDKSIVSNSVTAGLYEDENSSVVNFARESGSLKKSEDTLPAFYANNDEASLTITRVGQAVTTTTVYKNKTYTKTYTDFDFVAKDNDYMYVGVMATRGTVVEVTNVSYEKTGESQGA